MATIRFQLKTTNVSSGVVTLPASFATVSTVSQDAPGDYTSTTAVAPVTYTVVSTTPTTTTEVQLTAADTLTFESSTTLNTTYGMLTVTGTPVGAGPNVGP